MRLLDKQQRFTVNVSKLIAHIFNSGFTCTLGEAFRTPEQAEIYAKSGKGIKDSLHCKRLAIDINLFDPQDNYLTDTEDYKYFGEYWEKLDDDNEWGGWFKARPDGNHFQMKE